MIFARTHSRGAIGIQEGSLITIEAYTAVGLPQIVIIELSETPFKESNDRVKAALSNVSAEHAIVHPASRLKLSDVFSEKSIENNCLRRSQPTIYRATGQRQENACQQAPNSNTR